MFKHCKYAFAALFLLLTWSACMQEEAKEPLFNDGVPPAPIREASAENLPGAAKITYSLPDDPDLLYVKAVVEAQPGTIRETKASVYGNELLLECFAESREYDVKLYAVDVGENHSQPVAITVHPLTLPVQTVLESIVAETDFGGIRIGYDNETEAPIAVVVAIQDTVTGEWTEKDTYYTQQKSGYHTFRGFPPVETNFRIFVKDRCGNRSSESVFTLTPLYEEKIPKPFYTYNLPTDTYVQHCCGTGVDEIWDEVLVPGQSFHTKPGRVFPIHFTFDLGVTALLSRFKLWGRTNVPYDIGNVKEFEVWGTAESPSPDGSWEGWTKLLDGESVKPSGEPVGTNTAEDVEVFSAGEEFSFPLGNPPVRYIRFKTLSTWSGVTYTHIVEMSFWGQIE
jgi:hypothetical protein